MLRSPEMGQFTGIIVDSSPLGVILAGLVASNGAKSWHRGYRRRTPGVCFGRDRP